MQQTGSRPAAGAQDRLEFVDALRGLAAVSVVIYHLAVMPTPVLCVPHWAIPLVLNGGTGVFLFFIVSSFTLCHTMHQREGEPRATLRFYLRRVFRIVPLFYFWLLVCCLRDALGWGIFHSERKLLCNVLFLFNFLPGEQDSIVRTGWTIGVEMLFYLMFPFIFRRIRDYRQALGFSLLSLIVAGVFNFLGPYYPMPNALRAPFLYFSFFHMLPVFSCGVLTFYLHKDFVRDRPKDRTWSFVLICAATFVYGAVWYGTLNVLFDRIYWQGILHGAVVLALAMTPWRLIVNRLTCFLGTISYSLYLNHSPLIALLGPVYRKIYAYPLPATVKLGACALLTLGALVPLSYLTYRLIEQPGMRLGSRLIRRIAPGATASPSVPALDRPGIQPAQTPEPLSPRRAAA